MLSSHRAAGGTILAATLTTAFSLIVTGCGIGSSSATRAIAPVAGDSAPMSGRVHGGQQPVSGAVVQLYAVGTSGYQSAATPLISAAAQAISGQALTNKNGEFTLTGNYTCPSASSEVYLTASGGNPGIPDTTNSNLVLMAALGACGSLTSSTFINVNEVTTVAGAYALAQFSGGSAFGTALSSQGGVSGSTAPADNFATSSTNVQGLINAMNVASVLANTATGTSPGSNANGTALPEWWQINTIANIMAACINSSGLAAGENLSAPTTSCGKFFGNVKVPSGTNPATGQAYAAPADTLQATVYLALAPALTTAQISTLFGLAAATAPFQPYVASAASINDFSVDIAFNPIPQGSTGPALLTNGVASTATGTTTATTSPIQVAIDSYGNAWVFASAVDSGTHGLTTLVELDPAGNPIPQGAACTSPCAASNYVIASYNSGTAVQGGENLANYIYQQFGLDTNNNAWFPDYQAQELIKVPGSTSAGGVNGGNAGATGISAPGNPVVVTVDGANNVYYAAENNEGSASATCGSSWSGKARGLFQYNATGPVTNFLGSTPSFPSSLVVDGGTSASAVNFDSTGGSTIAGSPFIWVLTSNGGSEGSASVSVTGGSTTSAIGQFYTKGTTPCGTPLTVGSSTYGIMPQTGVNNPSTSASFTTGGTPTTQINAQVGSTDATIFMDNPADIAFDNNGNMFVTSANYTDSAKTGQGAFSKVAFNYANGFTPSAVQGATTFSTFNAKSGGGTNYGGIQTASGSPRFMSVDGAGSIWMGLNATNLGGFTNNGTPISPSTGFGFGGSTCSGCSFNGVTANYSRDAAQINRVAIDGSGNIWIPVTGSVVNITAYSITNNVVTFTTSAAPNFPVGQRFTVRGLTTGTFLDNVSFVVASETTASPYTLTANFTYPNTASTTDSGTATWGAVLMQVGTAVPVVTPVAAGLAHHTVGTKP